MFYTLRGYLEVEDKILIIEDDSDINNLLCNILRKNNYVVKSAYSGSEGKMCLDYENYDLVLLDLMLPAINGEELIEYIRENSVTPIIVISAKSGQIDKINVLKLGADDFISKPFDINEVIARVEAQIRRYKSFNQIRIREKNKLTHKNILLNSESREVFIKGEAIHLTIKEFDILELLMKNPSKVFTKSNIFESLWNENYLGDDNTVNVHVSNLRNKLLIADSNNEYIQTIWGIGFKLKD